MDVALQARAEQLAAEFADQASTAADLNGLMRLMMKSALERMLNTEMDFHLGRRTATSAAAIEPPLPSLPTSNESPRHEPTSAVKRSPNRRNGRSRKTIQGELGELARVSQPAGGENASANQLIADLGENSDVVSIDLCSIDVSEENLQAIEGMSSVKRLFVDGANILTDALARFRENRKDIEVVTEQNDREWLRMFPPSADSEASDTPIAKAISREAAYARIVRHGATVFSASPGDVSIHAKSPGFCGMEPLHLYRILSVRRRPTLDSHETVGDEVLPIVKDLNVRMVRLETSEVTDNGLKLLRNHPTIEDLRLNDRITDRGLENLGSMPKLRSISVKYGSKVTPRGLDGLRSRCPLLTDIYP